jgi:hypothetical protein
MTRSESIRRLVLNAICDDFENVDQVILPQVMEVGAKCGLAIYRSEVLEALGALVERGLAEAFDLSATDREPFSGEDSRNAIAGSTGKGLQNVLLRDETGHRLPFDR